MADIHSSNGPSGYGYMARSHDAEDAGSPLFVLALCVLFVAVFAVAWTYGAVGVVGALQSFGPELAAAPRLMK